MQRPPTVALLLWRRNKSSERKRAFYGIGEGKTQKAAIAPLSYPDVTRVFAGLEARQDNPHSETMIANLTVALTSIRRRCGTTTMWTSPPTID